MVRDCNMRARSKQDAYEIADMASRNKKPLIIGTDDETTWRSPVSDAVTDNQKAQRQSGGKEVGGSKLFEEATVKIVGSLKKRS